MIDHLWAEIIAAIIVAAVPLAGNFISTKFLRQKQEELKAQVQQVHILFNSRMTELIEASRRLAHAEGIAEGRQSSADDAAKIMAQSRTEDRADSTASAAETREATLKEASDRLAKRPEPFTALTSGAGTGLP